MKHIPHAGNAATPGNATLRSGMDFSGNANREIGEPRVKTANREIGDPGVKTANREIGEPKVKTANREIGDPGVNPGGANQWYSRGYLPHFDSAVAVQHVTFHLADSLPVSVQERLEQAIRCLPSEKQDAERRKRWDAWIDAGHGSCIMREPAAARIVQNAFLFFDGQRYRLLAWVVMPNHVHVLFQPVKGWTVAKIVASWKKFTATKICSSGNATLRSGMDSPGNATLCSGENKTANREIGDPGGKTANREIGDPRGNTGGKSGGGIKSPVWHREYWDRFIRDSRHHEQAVEYIHQNPVKAGLATTATEWPWSSASFSGMDSPGNATLRSGEFNSANREIGDPGVKTENAIV